MPFSNPGLIQQILMSECLTAWSFTMPLNSTSNAYFISKDATLDSRNHGHFTSYPVRQFICCLGIFIGNLLVFSWQSQHKVGHLMNYLSSHAYKHGSLFLELSCQCLRLGDKWTPLAHFRLGIQKISCKTSPHRPSHGLAHYSLVSFSSPYDLCRNDSEVRLIFP